AVLPAAQRMGQIRLWLAIMPLNQQCSLDPVRSKKNRGGEIRGERDRPVVKFSWPHVPSLTGSVGVEQKSRWGIDWKVQLSLLFSAPTQGVKDRHHVHGGQRTTGHRVEG